MEINMTENNKINPESKDDNNIQAEFMAALSSLKEYAKVNGNTVTRQDVESYFKNLGLDEAKYQMITGYLLANNITVSGENAVDNEFLDMLERAAAEEEASLEEKEAEEAVFMSDEDYERDEKYIEMYMEDLKGIEELSDTGRAFLLMNIVEDNDKESLDLLSQSFLRKIVEWIEPYRRKGVLSSDLLQEANLAMMGYMSEKRFLNNLEWKDKIKEGGTDDLLRVLSEMEEDVRSEVEGSLAMMIDEQMQSNKVTGRVLGKVNLVNDWAKRLREELGRKPSVDELAKKIGISAENVREAIRLSAENIEDIDMQKKG
jgi:DNA-directed RNA polymerase sigma subunit (sigma70/sigma32)